MIDTMAFPSGIPRLPEYEAATQSDVFRGMQRSSESFSLRNRAALRSYRKRWVSNPLNHWSRQWEYPFTYSKLRQYVSQSKEPTPMRVLDAGSGITFFPFYLASSLDVDVWCCDLDSTLADTYDRVRAEGDARVRFWNSAISDLPAPDAYFAVIYCISVLEHTSNWSAILSEFDRVLHSEGHLIVTFDISLDREADIPPEKAMLLLDEINTLFTPTELWGDVGEAINGRDILSTGNISQINPSLLPWRPSWKRRLLRSLRIDNTQPTMKDLTVFCAAFNKARR